MADPMQEFLDKYKDSGILSLSPTADDKQKAMTIGLIGAGLGILAANSQNPRGAGFAGALGGAMPGLQMYQQTLHNAPRERIQNMQGLMQVAQLKKQLEGMDALKNFTSGQQTASQGAAQSGMNAGTAVGDVGPTVTNAARAPASAPPNFGGLLAAGIPAETVKALMEEWKLKNPEASIHGGFAIPQMRGLTAPQLLPSINTSQTGQTSMITPVNGQPVVSAPQGALPTYQRYQQATEEAKAAYDPMLNLQDPQGRPIPMTRLEFARQRGAGITPEAQQPQSAPQAGGLVPGIGTGPTLRDRSEQETIGKKFGELPAKIVDNASSSASQLTVLNRIGADLQTFEPGKLTPLKKTIGEWAIGTGLMTPESANSTFGNIANMQEMTGVINRLVAQSVRQTDAQPAVRQIDMLRQSYPALDQTGEGARLLLDVLRKEHELNVEKLKYYNEARQKGVPIEQFEQQWNDVIKNFDYIPPEIRQKYPLQKPAGLGKSQSRIIDWKDLR